MRVAAASFLDPSSYKEIQLNIERCIQERLGVLDKRFDEVMREFQDSRCHLSGLMHQMEGRLQVQGLEATLRRPAVMSRDQSTQVSNQGADPHALRSRGGTTLNLAAPAETHFRPMTKKISPMSYCTSGSFRTGGSFRIGDNDRHTGFQSEATPRIGHRGDNDRSRSGASLPYETIIEATPLLSDSDDLGHDAMPAGMATGHNFGESDLHGKVMEARKLVEATKALQAGRAGHSDCGRAVTAFFEDPDSSWAANLYKEVMWVFNIAAIFQAVLQIFDYRLPKPHDEYADLGIGIIFLLEVMVRFIFSPSYCSFLASHENMVDFLSTVQLLVILIKDSFSSVGASHAEHTLFVFVPVVRLLRLVRRFSYIKILTAAFHSCLEALPVLLYTMSLIGCLFMTLIFLVEPRDNITSMTDSAWLVIATMTTVGFGDVVPVTESGIFLASTLMVLSSLYMAMPVAIVGCGFTETWGKRKEILLQHSVRQRLRKWGFGPYEIPKLFSLFDLDDSTELDQQEFSTLLSGMQIGFQEEEIVHLFTIIDNNCSGSINVVEFIKTLYPNQYRDMCVKGARNPLLASQTSNTWTSTEAWQHGRAMKTGA